MQYIWRVLDCAAVAMGFRSLFCMIKLPALLMLLVGHICGAIGWCLGRKVKINAFTVRRESLLFIGRR